MKKEFTIVNNLDIVNIAATLLDGTCRVAALPSQLYQEQDKFLVCATQQIAGGYIQVLKCC